MDFSEAASCSDEQAIKLRPHAPWHKRRRRRQKGSRLGPTGHLKGLLAALLAANLPTTRAFSEAQLYIEPTTVQFERASIGFWGIPEQTVPAGGYIKLQAPADIYTYTTELTCFDVAKSRACEVTSSRNEFIVQVDYEIAADSQFEFKIGKAINNPISEKPSDLFKIITSVNEVESDSEYLRVKATRGRMAKYILTPESDIVGASTTLKVEFKSEHMLPRGGYIFIDFPKWNPENEITDSQKPYIQGTEACAPVKILDDGLFCDFQNDRLIVQKSAVANIDPDTELSFEVTGFKNPIEAGYVSGFQIQTAILYGIDFYVIDEDVTQLTVSKYATLSSPSFSVLDTDDELAGMIQEINDMRLNFYLPVPLNPGCKVKIILPEQYSVDYIGSLHTQKAFGRNQEYSESKGNLRVIPSERSLTLIGACETYIDNNKVATIDIRSLKQPDYEKTTDSVQIFITTKKDQYIAMVDQKVTFTPQRGSIQVYSDALVKVVQESTLVMFELTPQHAIYIKDDPIIDVEFPQKVKIETLQCQIQDVTLTGSDGAIAEQCFRNQQSFRVSNFLPENQDYFPAGPNEEPKTIKFTVGLVNNPVSVQGVEGLNIVIYALDKYAIDEFEGPIGWMPIQGDFLDAKVVPGSPIAYDQDVKYTISFTPRHRIPQNGYIDIEFPKQISVPDYSFSQSSCSAVEASAFGTNQITCKFFDEDILSDPFRLRDPNTPDHFTMRVLNAFRTSGVDKGSTFSLVVPGLRNPIQTVPTLSFRFKTFDIRGNLIDEKLSGVQLKMTFSSTLDIVLVSLNSYVNARLTDYTITMVPTVPVWEQNLLLITFPAQIKLPETESELDCSTVFTSLIEDLKCRIDPNYVLGRTVRIEMTFAPGVKQIDALDRFSVTLRNIRNPTTTQTTDPIQIRITDREYIEINQKLTDTVVTTNNASTISEAYVAAATPQPGVESAFNLDFYPEHPIAPGGGILVVYPPQTTLGLEETLTAEISIDNQIIDQENLDISFDLSARTVTVKNIVQTANSFEPQPGEKIRVTIFGLRTPYTSAMTDSFQMTTFNFVDNTFYYFIDQVNTGLTINSKCNYPCKDCPAAEPSVCLSCYPADPNIPNGRPFLQVDTCVEECAVGRYYDEGTNRCELCDPTCLSCFGSAKTCTSCGIDEFLFLHEERCLTECPDRFIEDQNMNKCKACSGTCLTCEGLATSCTSCDPRSLYKFFFHDSCISECIPDLSVQVGDKCIECDSKCATCAGTPNTCTSCEPHMKLDPFKKTCEDLCTAEVQIYNELTKECEFCASTCTKCAGSATKCTECKSGFVLNFDQTCQLDCNSPNQTPIDGICQACEEPCYECGPKVSTCKTCIPDYALYLGTKCVQYCPEKYDTVDNICVYEGLICPDGFELNNSKDGCIPVKYDCDKGYIINKDKNACVPEPGSQVPFPFILSSILLSFLVLGSYLKDKPSTKVKTNLIALIGGLELIMYLMMVTYAYILGEVLILIFVLIGLLGLLASNILFVSYFKSRIIVNDKVFSKWLHFFPKTAFWLPFVCLILNFKFGKMFYSGFYGLESTMAQFKDHAAFYYMLRLTAYFSFIFCYGFIFIADILIISRVDWGYQLLVLAIETIVLQVLVIVLTVLEFRQDAVTLLSADDDDYPTDRLLKGKKGSQIRVMGGLEEDDYEEGIPDIDEDTLIRSKIKTEQLEIGLRQQALARILNQVGHHPTEKGVDIQDCLTKFDPERIKQRRCFSMSGLDSDESWVAEGDQPAGEQQPVQMGEVDRYGNFERDQPRARRYSFPLSPTRLTDLPDTLGFSRQIDDIKKANTDFLIDNVYTEAKKTLDPFAKRKIKTVSRRTQTYLRELLHVQGEEVNESDMEVLMEEEAELDFDFAKGLIDKVIDHISSADESIKPEPKTKKVKKKVFKAKKEIPDFELADIMGDFEIDDMGNFIIMRGDGGELKDQRERLVNRRGYLIDRFGNVINTTGNIIFKAIELDVDDEIPAPFGFEKRKKNLLKLGDENQFRVESIDASRTDVFQGSHLNHLDDEEVFEKEVNGIKEQSRLTAHKDTQSAKSLSADEANQSMEQAPSKNASTSHIDNGVISEEDNLEAEIDQAVRKKVPKKRKTLKGGKVKKMDNLPPRRMKPEDMNHLFPNLGIEHDEQRRLAKIASSISGLANQLADKQRQQTIIDNRVQGSDSQTLEQQQMNWRDFSEEQKIEQIRREQLNEIMAAGHEPAGGIDPSVGRPLSSAASLNIGNSGLQMSRQMSASAAASRHRGASEIQGLRRHRSSNKPVDHSRERTDEMKKVYSNVHDLSGFENPLMFSHGPPQESLTAMKDAHKNMRRGQSGRSGGRMAGLESIYMTKIPKARPAGNLLNANVRSQSSIKVRGHSAVARHSDFNPFRPTMNRFDDDPAELNVDTTMHGSALQGGRDILEIADKLDQMQRNYLHRSRGVATQKVSLGTQQVMPEHHQKQYHNQHYQIESEHNFAASHGLESLNAHTLGHGHQQMADAQTNSGGKGNRLQANSEAAYDSIEPLKKDNWMPGL